MAPAPLTTQAHRPKQNRPYTPNGKVGVFVLPKSLTEILSWSLLIALAALQIACSSEQPADQTANTSLKQVSGLQIEIQPNYQINRQFIGALQAPQRVELSFDASGPIKELLVNEGDSVSAGDTLAILDDTVLKAELNAAKASHRDLRSRYEFNQRELERLEKLRNQNFASESRFDELQTLRRSLKAQLDGVNATIKSLDARIEKTILKAPFTANISARFFDAGAIVNPGSPVLQLLENNELLVRLGIPVRLARQLSVGDELLAVIEDIHHDAIILSVGSSVSLSTNTIPIELQLRTNDGAMRLYDGQIVRLVVPEVREVAGTWIPAESLVAGVRGSWDVYVLATNDETKEAPDTTADIFIIERRKVNVEYLADGHAFISSGLSNNDKLVDKGVQKIAAGQLVTLHPLSSVAENY